MSGNFATYVRVGWEIPKYIRMWIPYANMPFKLGNVHSGHELTERIDLETPANKIRLHHSAKNMYYQNTNLKS